MLIPAGEGEGFSCSLAATGDHLKRERVLGVDGAVGYQDFVGLGGFHIEISR